MSLRTVRPNNSLKLTRYGRQLSWNVERQLCYNSTGWIESVADLQ